MFEKWLKILPIIPTSEPIICPSCRNGNVSFQYVGDIDSRIGYLDIWCDSCNHGIHLSRVKVPNNISMLSFYDNVSDVIPNFKQIYP